MKAVIALVAALAAGAAAAAERAVIIDSAEFARLRGSGAQIVDVRAPEAYAQGHAPGAVNLPWMRLNIPDVEGIRIEFAPDAALADAFGAAGLSYDRPVVIIDETSLAGRAFVAFEYAGFPDVRVLDGGMKAWTGPVTTEAPAVTPTDFALERRRELRVRKDVVLASVGRENVTILDGRNAAGYAKGRIPGAGLLFPPTTIDADGRYAARDALADMLAKSGATPDREVISYCGTGVMAAHNYLAMRDLGYENVSLYDEGWDEWKRDPANIER